MDTKAWRNEALLGMRSNTHISQEVAALLGDGPVKRLSSKTPQSNAPWSIVLLLATGPWTIC